MRVVKYLSLILSVLFFITACGSGESNNANDVGDGRFSDSDYSGEWSFLSWAGPAYGSLSINNSGNITQGDWTVMGESFGEYTGGMFSIIDEDLGKMNGATYSPTHNSVITDGQMGLAKDILVYTSITNTPSNNGIVISIKNEGIFDSLDLKGTWSMAFPDGYGYVTVDENGDVTGGVLEQDAVDSVDLTGGKLEITAQGVISGYLNTTEPNKYIIQFGQMNAGKNTIISTYLDLSFSNMAFIAVKREGTFSMSDLNGTFRVYQISITGSNTYGSIEIDDVGNVMNGSWIAIDTGSGTDAGTYTGGTISFHTIQGTIAETTINLSNGDILSIEGGQMNADKNAAIVKTNSGLLMLLKSP